jgi:mRNA interferase MazF
VEIRFGSLYLADLNPRLGSEAGRIRPVLVVQTDLLNRAGHPSTWILPCTTRLSGENILRVFLPEGIAGNLQNCEVMIDQSRTIDNRRFRSVLGTLPAMLMKECKMKLKTLGEL